MAMSEGLKVVQLVTQREPAGAQTVAISLHEGFLKRGIQSEVWFLYQKAPCFEQVPGTLNLSSSKGSGRSLSQILSRYLRELRRFSPDTVIAHTHYAILLGLPLARAQGVRSCIAVHHNSLETYPAVAKFAASALSKSSIVDSHIAVANHVLPSIPSLRSRCIHNGLKSQDRVLPERERIRAILDLQKGEKVLLNIGRLSAQKNQQFLLHLLAKLPNQRLVILGEGEDRQKLEELAQQLGVRERLLLKGAVSPSQVDLWLHAADIFLFPSKFEAMPVALVEAMRASIPIIASDIPAHREVAEDTVTLLGLNMAHWIENIELPDIRKVNSAAVRAAMFSEERMVSEYLSEIVLLSGQRTIEVGSSRSKGALQELPLVASEVQSRAR